ncbi:GNAT family N-acetyltransferase [Azospirillum sp. TSO22-1]|uniref:GNAT family N-acetyltransferase n=1 Tax=Azospirillum sp. TSO22-1 TaxID=716789 RepID=UPI000D64ED79|nr:GNAT family N-acetyltransferase [Azospirillum sp. TSO22-1]
MVEIDKAVTGRGRRGFYEKRFATSAGTPQDFVGLAAEQDGKVLGFVLAHLLTGEFGVTAPVGVLDAIGVDPTARGSGIGQRLLGGLEQTLAGRGVTAVRTEANWTEHSLIGFFAATGFRLAPRLLLDRSVGAPIEEEGEDGLLARDRVAIRSMAEDDLAALVRIDRHITGQDRSAYYARKANEVLKHSGVRVSLVAEADGTPVGFVMARVDFGEFGRTEPVAVMDTIGVDPANRSRHVGQALLSQLLTNLRSLHVERIITDVAWNDFALLRFLERNGFTMAQRLSFTKPLDPA